MQKIWGTFWTSTLGVRLSIVFSDVNLFMINTLAIPLLEVLLHKGESPAI